MTREQKDILEINQRLLDCIADGDWDTYTELCSPDLTCFEPETKGHLVSELEFHKFYFRKANKHMPRQETIVEPSVNILGETAIVCYTRLVQRKDIEGRDITDRFQETRVWNRASGKWVHIHFHRSTSEF